MGNLLVVQSKVRQIAKKGNLRMSGNAIGEISKAVEAIIRKAGERAKANKRKTIKPSDI